MTFEEIDLLVRRANPVPDPRVLEPLPSTDDEEDVRRGTTMQIQDLKSTAETQHRADARFPSGRVTLVAAAALVLAVALVAISAGTGGDGGTDTAGVPTVSPVAVADSFVDRLAEYDVVEAMSFLTADSLATHDGLASELRWREASGFQWSFDRCREVGGGSDHAIVRCPFAYQGLRSDALGLGPYEGGSYRIVIRDGRVDGFTEQLEFQENDFNDEVWEPFYEWLLATHPDDVAVMYSNDSAEGYSTTDESIALWERRTREYVDAAR